MVGRSGDLMTEINTFQDLLDLLDSNPDYIDELRVRLLTPELIALPAKFAELVATVAHISTKLDEFIATTDRRFETLEADVTTLKDERNNPQGRRHDPQGRRQSSQGRRSGSQGQRYRTPGSRKYPQHCQG